MIQRIQSIFLLLCSACFAVLFLHGTPFITLEGDQASIQSINNAMLNDGIFDISDHLLLFIITIIGAVLSFVCIFLFKNRSIQIKLTRLAIVLAIILLILCIILFVQGYDAINVGTEVIVDYGILLPIGAVIFGGLAAYYIGKDSRLVKSMDRLR